MRSTFWPDPRGIFPAPLFKSSWYVIITQRFEEELRYFYWTVLRYGSEIFRVDPAKNVDAHRKKENITKKGEDAHEDLQQKMFLVLLTKKNLCLVFIHVLTFM